MNDYRREERTTTVVRHSMPTPVNWVEVQKLLRVVLQDMGYGGDREPADDQLWYEVGDDEIVLCYQLTETATS